jgi:hypothetical protein
MNEFEHLSHMLPDYINGTLPEADKKMIQQALLVSPDLQEEYEAFKHILNALDKENIIELMNHEADFVQVKLSEKKQTMIRFPKIIIGATTSLAACLLLWIGISKNDMQSIQNSDMIHSQPTLISNDIEDELIMEMHSEDVEAALMDEILSVYTSDIESGKVLDPVLEEEITKYLLQEIHDEETM